MRLSDFNFELPDSLIARYSLKDRSSCRLLSLDGVTGDIKHQRFIDIISKLDSGDLLIFNNTKVIPARVYGKKSTGGKIEMLVERVLSENKALVHLKSSKSPQVGGELFLGNDDMHRAIMVARHDSLFELEFDDPILPLLDKIGHIPLPPYIDRADEACDREDYQTVYNKVPGAVAAPTAGLHFDQPLLDALKEKGVNFAFVTLHVGAGTFQPVRVDDIKTHIMHSEYAEVSNDVVTAINECKAANKKVIAVGTTSMRALESAAQKTGEIEPFFQDTRIFIYPGFQFNVVDSLITNFHLPESTLLMLVSAFSGYDNILSAYNIAIQEKYRFFSYGDAMFMTRKK